MAIMCMLNGTPMLVSWVPSLKIIIITIIIIIIIIII